MSAEDPDAAQPDSGFVGLRANELIAGRFRLERCLGRGGMGVVWSANDELLRKKRALKFLCDALANDDAAKADLADEVARCQELSHPHILRVHDFVEDTERQVAAVSMELAASGTLSARRVTKPHRWFECDEILPWVQQLCSALAYAHEEVGVIHRDLKPSNLLLDARDRLKLADFGISQALSTAYTRVTNRSSGYSLPYASPEQLSGEPPTPAQDLYSLGATLYELLTGKPPFYIGDVVSQAFQRIPDSVAVRRRQFLPAASGIPDHWEELIGALLAKDPAQRPGSAREVMRRLDDAVFHEPWIAVDEAPTIPKAPSPVIPFAEHPQMESQESAGTATLVAETTSSNGPCLSADSRSGLVTSPPTTSDTASSPSPEPVRVGVSSAAERRRRANKVFVIGAIAVSLIVLVTRFLPHQSPHAETDLASSELPNLKPVASTETSVPTLTAQGSLPPSDSGSAPETALQPIAEAAPASPATNGKPDSDVPSTALQNGFRYIGKVGPYDVTFTLQENQTHNITGSYTITGKRTETLRLEGKSTAGEISLTEYTGTRPTSHITLKERRVNGEVRLEGKMVNTAPDNRVFQVSIARPE